jgi:hypothetical protein
MNKFVALVVVLSISILVYPQARIVIQDGGIINITNSAYLVIDNPQPNAITRSNIGHIISEGENNVLRWNIGTNSGDYIVPFGIGPSTYLPLSLSLNGANGNGHFIFSTYGSPTWQNSLYMPSVITHMNSDIDGSDNSNHVTDRFYQVNPIGYTLKPTATNLQFSYLDTEHSVASNTIIESFLQAQRWNPTLGDWNDLNPIGTANTTQNTVDIISVAPSNLYGWWVLVDNQYPLPISLTWFKSNCILGKTILSWETASELNNDYFVVERSLDGITYHEVGRVESFDGTSNTAHQYQLIDTLAYEGISYYRLKQIDFSGHFTYSSIIKHECLSAPGIIKVYPNPSSRFVTLDISGIDGYKEVTWYNVKGQVVIQSEILQHNSSVNRQYDISHLAQGAYLLQLKVNNQLHQIFKIIKE